VVLGTGADPSAIASGGRTPRSLPLATGKEYDGDMKRESIKDVLDRLPAVESQGEAYLLGPSLDATVFAQAGADVLTVPRVDRIELRPEYAALMGSKGEILVFPYEQIAGLKIEPRGGSAVSGGTSKSPPGFGAR